MHLRSLFNPYKVKQLLETDFYNEFTNKQQINVQLLFRLKITWLMYLSPHF